MSILPNYQAGGFVVKMPANIPKTEPLILRYKGFYNVPFTGEPTGPVIIAQLNTRIGDVDPEGFPYYYNISASSIDNESFSIKITNHGINKEQKITVYWIATKKTQ